MTARPSRDFLLVMSRNKLAPADWTLLEALHRNRWHELEKHERQPLSFLYKVSPGGVPEASPSPRHGFVFSVPPKARHLAWSCQELSRRGASHLLVGALQQAFDDACTWLWFDPAPGPTDKLAAPNWLQCGLDDHQPGFGYCLTRLPRRHV